MATKCFWLLKGWATKGFRSLQRWDKVWWLKIFSYHKGAIKKTQLPRLGWHNDFGYPHVVTLALGSWPRHKFVRGWAKRGTQECGRVWDWTLTLPSELPCWELESWWTPKTSKSGCKGQNPSPWIFLYIIGKLLKRRCPKWAHMTHLDISNTNYGQNKSQESNWQFDSQPWKVRNRLDSLACRWRVTCRWKAFDEGYNFNLNPIPIGGLHKTL
jgi:hypothetical protein